jgi:hypothetical protein
MHETGPLRGSREQRSSGVKDEEFVNVPVPRSMVLAVYRLISQGAAEPATAGAPMADPAVITTAYQESSHAMKAFLDLLAAHPDEWLSIDTVRTELGLGVHELAGVLSTLPRRWRGRYRQSGPLPFEVEGTGSRRRYRMGQEVAELITSLR